MARPSISPENRQKVLELSATMSASKIARELGVDRRQVVKVLNPEKERRKGGSTLFAVLKRQEARLLPHGCFNVYQFGNWIVG